MGRSGQQKLSEWKQALAGFDKGAGTTSTDMHPLKLALIKYSLLLDIGLPLPVRGFLGMTYIVAELGPFST
jgi:hypothetical protein